MPRFGVRVPDGPPEGRESKLVMRLEVKFNPHSSVVNALSPDGGHSKVVQQKLPGALFLPQYNCVLDLCQPQPKGRTQFLIYRIAVITADC